MESLFSSAFTLFPEHDTQGMGRPLTKGRKKSNKKTMKHTLKPRQSHTF